MANSLTWRIGGEAGFGIMAAGAIFSKALTRAKFYIASAVDYPSLIRGGHNTFVIRASNEPIYSLVKPVDLLVALNQETITLHKDELSSGAGVIYDSGDKSIDTGVLPKDNFKFYPVPLLEIATKDGGHKLMMNNVALGVSWAVLNLPLEILTQVIADVFAKKGEEIVAENTRAAKAGYDYVKTNFPEEFSHKMEKGNAPPQLVVTGNEAMGLGALKAGLGFAALYPMTPINGLLHFLASHEFISAEKNKRQFVYYQPEDEIAGINSAIGASYGGLRSLVATSGGGFSLMVEALGMAAMTEIPLVVVMGTRPGPSSGLPTWTGQGDLKFMLSASQGDFTRVVLAPGDPEEAFEMIQTAFNLSDKYQTPVIVLVDKLLCENTGTMDRLLSSKFQLPIERGKLYTGNGEYKRYEVTEDGISPRALPGQTYFITNSYEHNEAGLSTEEAKDIESMVEKRARKYELLTQEVAAPQIYGDKEADITLVGWGSTKGVAREVVENMKLPGKKLNYLHLNWINPFPKEALVKIFSQVKKIVDIEANSTAQMAGWIREQTGIEIKDRILKYDGRPFYPEEIIEALKKYA